MSKSAYPRTPKDVLDSYIKKQFIVGLHNQTIRDQLLLTDDDNVKNTSILTKAVELQNKLVSSIKDTNSCSNNSTYHSDNASNRSVTFSNNQPYYNNMQSSEYQSNNVNIDQTNQCTYQQPQQAQRNRTENNNYNNRFNNFRDVIRITNDINQRIQFLKTVTHHNNREILLQIKKCQLNNHKIKFITQIQANDK